MKKMSGQVLRSSCQPGIFGTRRYLWKAGDFVLHALFVCFQQNCIQLANKETDRYRVTYHVLILEMPRILELKVEKRSGHRTLPNQTEGNHPSWLGFVGELHIPCMSSTSLLLELLRAFGTCRRSHHVPTSGLSINHASNGEEAVPIWNAA